MRRFDTLLGILPALLFSAAGGCAVENPRTADGKALFMQYCTGCHPDGGNAVNPAKTLRKIDRQANGVVTSRDIVARIRNPGPGMPQFDRQRVPDEAAKAIADYVLKSY